MDLKNLSSKRNARVLRSCAFLQKSGSSKTMAFYPKNEGLESFMRSSDGKDKNRILSSRSFEREKRNDHEIKQYCPVLSY